MPLLRKRQLRPRTIRFLHRQLESPDVDAQTKEKIALVLDDPKLAERVNAFAFGLLKKANALDAPDAEAMAVGAVGGPFLDKVFAFLAEHWDEILAFLISLFL